MKHWAIQLCMVLYNLGQFSFRCLIVWDFQILNRQGMLHSAFIYRTCAIKGRSLLVAAPLRFQAKNDFLCAFLCGNLEAKNAIFELKPRPAMARLRYLTSK